MADSTIVNSALYRDISFRSVGTTQCLAVPIVADISSAAIQPSGCLAYANNDGALFVSSGGTWQPSSGTVVLPSSLNSIAGLTTGADDMLYTTATNTYTTTKISGAGRSFVSAITQGEQQTAIGLIPGSDVQEQSSVLNSLITFSGTSDQIVYSTGSGYAASGIAAYARTNILPITSATGLQTLLSFDYLPPDPNGGFDLSSDVVLGAVASQTVNNKVINTDIGGNTLTLGAGTSFDGISFSNAGSTNNGNVLTIVAGTAQWTTPLSGGDVVGPGSATDNAIVRFDSTTGKLIQNSGVILDDSNNLTGIGNITSSGTVSATTLTGSLSTAAQTSVTSVGTLTSLVVSGTTTLSGTTNLNAGAMIPTSQVLTITDAPTSATDAANKSYVDSVAASGIIPLEAAQGTTDNAVLPNSPVYSSSAGTLTATGAVTSLTLDGVTYVALDGQRLLVKDQADPRQNGIYTRTADSGGNWQLTRTTDFNQAPAETGQGDSIFVENGTNNANTSWILLQTVTVFDPPQTTPGTSDVLWTQSSGSQNLQPGTGMSQTGNAFNVNGTASRISVTATTVDIAAAYVGQTSITTLGTIGTGTWNGDVISPSYGGTGLSDPTTGNVLVTAGAGNMTLKTNPSGALVGDTDSQTLSGKILNGDRIVTAATVFANTTGTANTLSLDTSSLSAVRSIIVPNVSDTLAVTGAAQTFTAKTITDSASNISARALFSNSGANTVSVFGAANPSTGQVLTAVNATSATWQALPSTSFAPSRTLFVHQSASGAPEYTTLAAAITAASALTPTAANPVMIQIFPGTYYETIPLNIPQYVTITGITSSQSSVIIRPANNPATGLNMMVCPGNVRLHGFILDGNTTGGAGSGNAAIGILSNVGVVQGVDVANSVTVRNVSNTGFRVSGNSTAQFSKILICKTTSVQVTQVGFTMTTGYDVTAAGLLSGNDLNVSGFFVSGFNGIITNGFCVQDDFSWTDVNLIQSSFCTNAVVVGTNVSSNSKGDYPVFRCVGANVGRISQYGIWARDKARLRLSDFKIEDNVGQFPNQIHVRIESPALPADPIFISAMWLNVRFDLIQFAGAGATTNPPILRGSNLSETPGEVQSKIQGELTVGLPGAGHELVVGEGDSHTIGMIVFLDDGGVFTDVTGQVNRDSDNPIAVDIATTVAINIASAPATIDGVVPTSGVTRVLIKDGSTANPGALSVDNGIYIWNGTGAAMTRASDFGTGSTFTDKTYFAANTGSVNYRNHWKLEGEDGAGNAIDRYTVGTNPLSMTLFSSAAFPIAPVNNDAIYIGSTSTGQFPGIKINISADIVTSGPSVTTVVVWEYWNGSSWTTLPQMLTHSNVPYDNEVDRSWGYLDTVTNPNTKNHHHRFGDIDGTWSTTSVNGTSAYWIRSRVIDAANITQVPVFTQVKIHTNRTEINADGYTEFFGKARYKKRVHVPITSLNSTGTGGETAPTTQRMVYNTGGIAGTIATNQPNAVWANNTTTAVAFGWNAPIEIDTSHPMEIHMIVARNQAGGAGGNTAWRVDYTFTKTDSIIGNPSGAVTQTINRSSGILAFATSTSGRGESEIILPMNITSLDPVTDTIWMKISRLGSDGLDTYNSTMFLLEISLDYLSWTLGGHLDVVD